MGIPLESPLGPNYLRVPDGSGGFTDRHWKEVDDLRQVVVDAAITDGQCAVALAEARGTTWRELEPPRAKSIKDKRAYDSNVLDALEPLLLEACNALSDRMTTALRKRRDELERAGVDHIRATGKLLLRKEWHERRIWGLWDIINRVETCGTVDQVLRCQDCGHAWPAKERCEVRMLCRDCEQRAIWAERKMLDTEIEAAEERAEPGYTRKHIVLPLPHFSAPDHNASGTWLERAATTFLRVRVAGLARAKLFRMGRDFLKTRNQSWEWWASFEGTAGADGEGHPHWHTITLSPFLPDPLVAAWWGSAIEQCGQQVMRRSLADALERLKKLSHPVYFPGYRKELVARATVPWTVPGVRAPRKKKGENATDYILRRAHWASSCPVWPAKRRTLPKCFSSLRRKLPRELAPALTRIASLPHAVVYVGGSASAAELVKYTLKPHGMTDELHARFFLAMKKYRMRHIVTSKGQGLRKEPGAGCPGVLTDGTICGSKRIKIERPKPDRTEQLYTLTHYLSGRKPEWLEQLQPVRRNE